jgi:hypothetical protein
MKYISLRFEQGQVARLMASDHDQLPKFVMRAFTQAQYWGAARIIETPG